MNLRTRLLVTSLLLIVLPLGGLAWLLRQGMTERLSTEYSRRVETLIRVE